MPPRVYVWADESCLGNQFSERPSPGGAAGLIEHWDGAKWIRRDYWVCEPATTNNRMAIRSATEGLRLLRKPCEVILTSDSQYLTRALSDWLPGWIQRGWRRKEGPVENELLWKALVDVAEPHQIEPRWVRGHAGHVHNEYANFLATRAARSQDASGGLRDSGFLVWLEEQRTKYKRYADFNESAPPANESFQPMRRLSG